MTETSSSVSARLSATGLAAGHILGGKYRVERQLGSGGMGVVLSARHLDLDALVAIKVIREEYARNEEVVARMLFEARAAARLRSSHVVRVLDVDRLDSGAPYIVMEHLEGCDLATLLGNAGPLPCEEVVDYILQACEGLVEAHGLGIIHRDLKPENLFRASTPEGFVLKVLDFGISKDTGVVSGLSPRSVMTDAGSAVGSPHYMSPEQMRAENVDARADIWSLGAILYELLSGRCPFEGESLPVVCAGVLSETEATPLSSAAPGVPAGLSEVVARCLQKKRDARFANVSELVAALREYASVDGRRTADRSSRTAFGSGVQYRRDASTIPAPLSVTTTTPVAPSPRPRAGRSLSIAIAALALAGLAVGWGALHRPTEPPPINAAASPAVEAPAAAVAVPTPPSIAPASPTPETPSPAVEPTSVGKPRSAAKRATPRAGNTAASSAPASPAPAVAAPATSPTPKPSTNAWDPDRLGGRY